MFDKDEDKGRDASHDTNSSIQAAIDEYSKNPVKNLTIYDTTLIAASLVKHQFENEHSLARAMHDNLVKDLTAYGFATNPKAPYKAALDLVHSPDLVEDKTIVPEFKHALKDVRHEIKEVTKARNDISRFGPVAP